MKLSLFNQWKRLGIVSGIQLEYQTAKAGNNSFATYIRDAKTEKVITKGFGVSKESAQESALNNLKRIGPQGIHDAINNDAPVIPSVGGKMPDTHNPEKDDKVWSDGIGHSHRAQKKIVGEELDIEFDENLDESFKEVCRNFVAKNAHKVNKAGPMKDKKNDYSRKEKHKKKMEKGDE